MTTLDVQDHAKAISESGYTVIPGQVGMKQLAELNAGADRAIAALDRALETGVKPAHTLLNPHYRAARCFYCWDRSCRDLLEHDVIHAVATAVLGKARLWDMSVLEARPMPNDAELGPFDWHRDFPISTDDDRQSYLWLFVCLTDTTTDNGATWVIPGSHRDASIAAPKQSAISEMRPSTAVQLTASAGDVIAINPVMLHAVGENRTANRRRLALVGLCRADQLPLMNHWAIASQDIRDTASDRLRRLLYADESPLDETWDVLPEGWQPAARPSILRRVFRGLHLR